MLFGFAAVAAADKMKIIFPLRYFQSAGCHFVQINDLNLVHGSNLNGKICEKCRGDRVKVKGSS